MRGNSGPASSVARMLADRARRRDRDADQHLLHRNDEQLTGFRQQLENFELTDAIVQSGLDRIRRAFERG